MVGNMNKLFGYLKRRLKPGQRVILENTPTQRTEMYLDKYGEPVIKGVTKCTFTWHRNCK